jgi:RNA polymerase sigma factor (sigma-70 family)
VSSFCIEVPDTVLARARRGDVPAFEQIYRLFERPAWTLALRMCGDPDDAREVMHDAMLRLFERIGQFRGESPFWGWVRQIVLNEALMRLRRERGKVFESLDDEDEAPADTAAPLTWSDPQRLDAALNRLPATTRSVIWLYHVEGYTHPEIAEMTGKSVSFSKSQLARGTARLREMLESSEAGFPCMHATPVVA